MKFGIDVIPLEDTSTRTFLLSTIVNKNMAEARTCEVGATLASARHMKPL
jgi:hypothetical protein